MQRRFATLLLIALTGGGTPVVLADPYHGGWHHHGHGHGDWHHHGHGHPHFGPPAYYGNPYPPAYYAPRPPPPVYYPVAPAYPAAPAYGGRYGRMADTLPIVAGGIVGGAVGNEASGGNPAAIISGSVLGSVVGRELAR